MSSDYHAKYWAAALRAQQNTSADVTTALASARVDLNPHQVEAASFALRSPLSRGVVLADEVGLGKTIEAGLVLLQLWSRRRRRLLIIAPATLRRQWISELETKFGLPARLVDKDALRHGSNPFDDDSHVLICSYHFAAEHRNHIRLVPWDRVVFDEAHQLRNVWKKDNRRARKLKEATADAPTVLLTATPLQNSLIELFGLGQFVDDHLFGDQRAFRSKYEGIGTGEHALAELKERLKPVVKRTLRKQVTEFVKFTRRVPFTEHFVPSEEEQQLYELVSEYLREESSYALPKAQRALITLVMRKLLASSTPAIEGTLRKMADRLRTGSAASSDDVLSGGELEIDEDFDATTGRLGSAAASLAAAETAGRLAEADRLTEYADLAASITVDAKARTLLEALPKALRQAGQLGAQRKAVIFTENRRTQKYLVSLLEANGFGDQVVTINGENKEPLVQQIYRDWRAERLAKGQEVGNAAADTKSAVVEAFRNTYSVLVATEAAAEGLNLQFCSLVVNYDLPWNPQRVEQRIGRCHRYGQQHDVVVMNFVNQANEADQRVFELLNEKFQLFEGVFGASDEVLGSLESGFDLEQRIGEIYQQCRTAEEIDARFARLREELQDKIDERMGRTRATLLQEFDEEVLDRLELEREDRRHRLDTQQSALWELTRWELRALPEVSFDAAAGRFHVEAPVELDGVGTLFPGLKSLQWKDAEATGASFYTPMSELAQGLVDCSLERVLPVAEVELDHTHHGSTVGAVQALAATSGVLSACLVTMRSAKDSRSALLLAAVDDDGAALDAETIHRLLSLRAARTLPLPTADAERMSVAVEAQRAHVHEEFSAREEAERTELFYEESQKLDRWADDLKAGLELEIKELDQRIAEAKKQERAAKGFGMAEMLKASRSKQELTKQRTAKRVELQEQMDEVAEKVDELLVEAASQLESEPVVDDLFTIRWRVV